MTKLTALQVKNTTKPGMFHDGGGLYLQVSKAGGKSWVYRYFSDGKSHDHGLGSFKVLTLAEAREAAQHCRKLRAQGLDPIEAKQKRRVDARLEVAKTITFKTCTEQFLDAHEVSWKNNRHRSKWGRSLELYAYPTLGDLPVGQIDANLVFNAIDPIWRTKNETASRVRGRIETVLDWAKVRGYRAGENPARWKGNLFHLLPARDKIKKVNHLKSLPYAELPKFWEDLSKRSTPASILLRFTILTAARTGDVRFAVWSEIDFENKIWTIPSERMKGGKEHRVPLSPEAVKILKEQKKKRINDFIFPGPAKDKAFSENAMLTVLKDMGYKGTITVHGFRSSFKVWASEMTDYPNEVSEFALAHVQGNKVQEAYKRTDLLEKRIPLMEDFSAYCLSKLKSNIN